MPIKPVKDRVLVRQDPATSKIGLIHTPDGSEKFPPFGTVLALGPDAFTDGTVKVGDRVMFNRQPGSALHPDNREGASEYKDLLMLKAENVIAVVE